MDAGGTVSSTGLSPRPISIDLTRMAQPEIEACRGAAGWTEEAVLAAGSKAASLRRPDAS
jgi:hypothetical protein